MKDRKLFTSNELRVLPIGFQFFKFRKEPILQKNEESHKVVTIKAYNSNAYRTFNHYKPLSKIIKSQL